MDRHMDGQMDGQMEGWKDRQNVWTDRYTEKQPYECLRPSSYLVI